MNDLTTQILISDVLIIMGVLLIVVNILLIKKYHNSKHHWVNHIFIMAGMVLTVASSIYFESLVREFITHSFVGICGAA